MSKTLKITNGDIVRIYSNTGYTSVEDTNKCKQDVAMILSTSIRTSTGLGCGLAELIGKDSLYSASAYGETPLLFDFQNRLRWGLNRLIAAQKSMQYDVRTPKELIFDFSPAVTWRAAEDPRVINFELTVVTEDGRGNFSLGGVARV
jgi:hypothetical protein